MKSYNRNFWFYVLFAVTSVEFNSFTGIFATKCLADDGLTTAKTEIRQLLDSYFELAQKADWDALENLYSVHSKMFADQASIFDRKRYFELLRSEHLEVKSWHLSNVEISVADGGTWAWCRYQGQFDHGTFQVSTVETLIFEKQTDWKIVHTHASIKLNNDASAVKVSETGGDQLVKDPTSKSGTP